MTVWMWLAELNRQRFGGHDDWRLPTTREMHTIFDPDQPAGPALPLIFWEGCEPGCVECNCMIDSGIPTQSGASRYQTATSVRTSPTRHDGPARSFFFSFSEFLAENASSKIDAHRVVAVRRVTPTP